MLSGSMSVLPELAGIGAGASQWLTDPLGAWKALRVQVESLLPKFTARQREMTRLEQNLIAFGRALSKVPDGAPKQTLIKRWQAGKSEITALRSELEQTKARLSSAIGSYSKIRAWVASVPGANLSGLGIAPAAIFATGQFIATLAVVTTGLVLGFRFVAHFDKAASNDVERWRDIQKLPPAERKAAVDAYYKNQGDSSPLTQFVGKVSGAIMWVVAAAVLLPMVLRAARR